MSQRIWIAGTLLLVLGLVLTGCGEKLTAEEIVARMQETVETTEDAYAVVTANVNAQGIEMSATAEIWEKSPNKVRVKVLEASEPDLVGTILVSDGQQGWYYEPARNVVMVGSADEVETPLPQQMLSELERVLQQVLEVSNVELRPDEEVIGRQTYVLELSPKEDAEQQLFPGNGSATLWVDQEQWIVLKATYDGGTFGQGTMVVQEFEMNPGLDEDLFTFQVPDGAKVVDIESQQPVALTLDEARAQAGFPLLVPEYVPAGATLIEVFRMGESFVLRYDHSAQVAFTVIQGLELAGPPPLGQAQQITVRGQGATAITDEAGGNTFLYWTENGVTVTVAGHIGLDEALQVAESLR